MLHSDTGRTIPAASVHVYGVREIAAMIRRNRSGLGEFFCPRLGF
jgi:hypothetical protein